MEGSVTAIIVGVLVTAFVFVLVFFIFGTVLYKLLCRRQATATITASYEMSAGDLPRGADAGGLEGAAGVHHMGGAMGGARNMNVRAI